ncbi:DUF2935 domain-containing protein [Effusibacillus consociatus]|uniref:DUF2935 domain-containing protein n=1 Tax=Effusibacillus consociatus TaxID=1117041 RepID=A0ABV9Q284_9BACL
MEDQLGHAVLMKGQLDPVELALIKEADVYIQAFQGHSFQDELLKGYLRFSGPNYPYYRRFLKDVANTTVALYHFIRKFVQLYKKEELINKTTLRFMEHHFFETCYFLNKLAYSEPEIEIPDCLLTKPDFPSYEV